MAEERIIDDDLDKNKKYRIVKGEDGEDELIINEVEEEAEDPVFEDGGELIDDEEMGVLTAEQYEAARILKEEEDARRERELTELREKVKSCMEEDKFSDVLECVENSAEFGIEDGEFDCVKLEALTRKFTDFTDQKAVISAAKDVSEASPEHRARLYEIYNQSVEKLRAENAEMLEEINARYSAEQQSRREILAPRKKKTLINFVITLAVFAVFLVAAIVCSTMMFSRQDGLMLYITIALAVIAFAALVALVFATRAFVGAAHMSAANEKDKSTKLGRERHELVVYGETLKTVSIAIAPEESAASAEE